MMKNVTILGDSRVFDTYFTNAKYEQRYGYDQTFPHIWRGRLLANSDAGYDVVHIPDHFRSGTIQNNIVRLALTNPAVVVIVDGIWETLLNKGHFLEYAERKVRSHSQSTSEPLNLTFASNRLVELYRAGELSVSPQGFAERIRVLVSYFRRRRRQVIVATVPVLPKEYIGNTYHAGEYQPLPDWDEVCAALNETTEATVEAYGGHVLNLTSLVDQQGGPAQAFIDQWHFSSAFHNHLAGALDMRVQALLPETPDEHHVSHEYMLGPISNAGRPEVAVYTGDAAGELDALANLGSDQILVYPEELSDIVNPVGNDRAEFEMQAQR